MVSKAKIIILVILVLVLLAVGTLAVLQSTGTINLGGTTPTPTPTTTPSVTAAVTSNTTPSATPSATPSSTHSATPSITPSLAPAAGAPVTTPAPAATAAARSYTQYTGYDLAGGDVKSMAANPGDCQAACNAAADCTYYVTDNTGSTCWLKKAPTAYFKSSARTAFAQPGMQPTFKMGSILGNGQWLFTDGTGATGLTPGLLSDDGRYQLYLQGDANICLHKTSDNKQCWCSGGGSSVPGPYKLIMQPDNNLTCYAGAKNNGDTGPAAGTAIWSSKTNGIGAAGSASAVMQNDGNWCVYAGGKAIWASQTAGC